MPVTRSRRPAVAAALLLPAALAGQVPKECRSERPYPPTGYVVEAPFDPFRNAWPDSVLRLLHETEALPPGSRAPVLEAAAARWPRAALLPALAMLIADGTGTIEIVGPDLDDLIDLYRSLDGPAAPLLWVAEGAGALHRRLPVLWAMPQRITPSDAVVLLRWGCQAGWLLAKVSENDLKGEAVIPPRIHHA